MNTWGWYFPPLIVKLILLVCSRSFISYGREGGREGGRGGREGGRKGREGREGGKGGRGGREGREGGKGGKGGGEGTCGGGGGGGGEQEEVEECHTLIDVLSPHNRLQLLVTLPSPLSISMLGVSFTKLTTYA